jgi:hypothetical protein
MFEVTYEDSHGQKVEPGHVVAVLTEPYGSPREVMGQAVVVQASYELAGTDTVLVEMGDGERLKVPARQVRFVAVSRDAQAAAAGLVPLEYVWAPEVTRQVVTATTDVMLVDGGEASHRVGFVTATHELRPAGFFGGRSVEIEATSLYSKCDRSDPASSPTGSWDRCGERRRFWPCYPEGEFPDHVAAFDAAVAWVKDRYEAGNESNRRESVMWGQGVAS